MKPYRLLRNNKESGPYSAEELIQMGLKAYDLIWEDGKSASWRYPCEISALKPYAPEVEEQPFDRFYKKPSVVDTVKKENPSSADLNAIPSVAVKPQKPRIRIKADSKIIEVPAPQPKLQKENLPQRETQTFVQKETQTFVQKEIPQKETIKPVTQVTQTNPDWRDMWLNWEEEKKAVNAANRVNVQKTLNNINRYQTSVSVSEDSLETKFSQSLDDIKERYVETVLKKKKNSNKNGSFITVAVLVSAILAMGVYMGLKWGSPPSNAEQKIVNPQPQQVNEPTAQNEQNNNEQNNNEQNNNEQNNSELKQANDKENEASVSTEKNSNSGEAAHVIQVPVVKKNIAASHSKPVTKNAQQKEIRDSYTYLPSAPIDKSVGKEVVQNSTSGSLNVPADVQATAIAKYKKSEPKIADYINVDAFTPYANTAVGVKLKIQNVSDIAVDLVMVDLQYYDVNGRFEKGETLYVRNIAAGSTVTIPAPDDDKAAKVNYKVSMVSSEKNNLYLIAD
jgi:hypothetical protein